ncbi:MAG TPA: YceI family protein [Pirellulales bacterium]|nr:YceI family protein [Pirellulales bacterium]
MLVKSKCRVVSFAALSLLAGWLLCPSLSCAEDGQTPNQGEIALKASRVYVFVGKVGLGHEHAVVGRMKSGFINLGAKSKAGEIVFDMPSFAADTAEARKYLSLEGTTAAARQKEVTDNMLGGDVLDVRKHPTASFAIASALPLGKRSQEGHALYRLEGEFTLHGVKRPLKLDAELVEEEGRTRVRGSFAVKQTDFGIKPFSKAFGAVGVTDELKIYGEIVLEGRSVAERRGPKRQ